MLENSPGVEYLEKKPEELETGTERMSHLDVATQMKEHNAYFVHMIQVTNLLDVSENNKSVDTSKLDVADKLDIVYGTQPTLSTSTLRPNTKDATFHGGFGVIFSHGEIVSAARGDNGTIATSHKERHTPGGQTNAEEDVTKAIERDIASDSYNEIVLKEPVVAGGFMKLASFTSRTTYEEEIHEYHGGEEKKSKIGIINMAPEVDSRGRLTGANSDKPFAVLLEMSKRGKVFVMDENNQMNIVTKIDEKTKQVEFNAQPINPGVFAEAYGEEVSINKYAKAEMEERLLKKGIQLN